MSQFGIALSFSGQVLVFTGIWQLFKSPGSGVALTVAAFELALLVALPNFIHRVWSTYAAAVALCYALQLLGLGLLGSAVTALAFALAWLNETSWVRHGTLWRPAAYGLAAALLHLDSTLLFGHGTWLVANIAAPGWLAAWAPQLGRMLFAAVFVYVVARLVLREEVPLVSRAGATALGAAILIMAASYPAPGVGSGLLLVLVGFSFGKRVLIGIGIVGLASFLSHYYYAMQATLLVKSAVLIATGLALLGCRYALRAWLPKEAGRA